MKLFLGLLFCSFMAYGSSEKTMNETVDFFEWLVSHQKDFASCSIKKIGDDFELCDHTLVSEKDLRLMFKLEPKDLVAHIQTKNVKVTVLCAEKSGLSQTFPGQCEGKASDSMFAEITELHGKYVPSQRNIYVKSFSTKGSLIHEYIHFLQSENGRLSYGKIYKKERNRLQAELTLIMDSKIKTIQGLEAQKKKNEIGPHVQEFMLASQLMKHFADWQDLIDERGIFLLYLKYGKELGASEEDLKMAKLNMGHICKNEKLKKILPPAQCAL